LYSLIFKFLKFPLQFCKNRDKSQILSRLVNDLWLKIVMNLKF